MSKTIENTKIQALIYFVTVLIICFILWPLLDMFWCAVITHSEFSYNPSDYLIEPIIFSVLMTLFFYLPVMTRARKNGKKAKKSKK